MLSDSDNGEGVYRYRCKFCIICVNTVDNPARDIVVDWRGYHRTSPVDTLPWLCPRRHGTSQPVPATLSRRLTHINHTRFTVHVRPRSPDNQAKITYPVGVPEASALDGCHFCSARDSTSCFSGRQAQSPQISRFSWSQPTML